jgi:hypothetical protein
MEDIVIRGSGGLAREIAFLIERINQEKPKWNLLGYIDIEDVGKIKYGYEVLGDDSWFEKTKNVSCVIAIGDSNARFKVYQQIRKYNLNFPNIIHPKWEKILKWGMEISLPARPVLLREFVWEIFACLMDCVQ